MKKLSGKYRQLTVDDIEDPAVGGPKLSFAKRGRRGQSPKLGDYTAKHNMTPYSDWLVHNAPIMSKAKENWHLLLNI